MLSFFIIVVGTIRTDWSSRGGDYNKPELRAGAAPSKQSKQKLELCPLVKKASKQLAGIRLLKSWWQKKCDHA